MTNEANMEKLMADIKVVTRDAETILAATAGEAGDKMSEVRTRLSSALASAKERYGKLQEKTIAGMKATDRTIREHPYQSLGAAFGIGLLLGVIARRR